MAQGGPSQASASGSASPALSDEQVEMVVNNTAAVLTGASAQRDEWLDDMQGALQQAQQLNAANEVLFLQAVVDLLNGQEVTLPPDSPYASTWAQLQARIAQRRSGDDAPTPSGGLDERALNAIAQNTVAVLTTAPDRRGEWRQNANDVRNQATLTGDTQVAALMGAIVQLLDANGDASGITPELDERYGAVWQRILDGLPASAAAKPSPASDDDAAEAFVTRAVAAIQGDGDAKAAFMNWAYTQSAAWVAPLMQIIPRVLFGTPVSEVSADELPEAARAIWQRIVARVNGTT